MKHTNDEYVYDGSFDGLCTVFDYLLNKKIIPAKISKNENTNINLFSDSYYLKTDVIKAKYLTEKIKQNISYLAFYHIYNVFLSSEVNKELIMLYFLINGFKYGYKVVNLRNLKCVLKTEKISKYVRMEAHKMKGFLRFKELNDNILFANYSSENDILELLVNHFIKRLTNESFLIQDLKRNKIGLYSKGKYLIVDSQNLDKKILDNISKKEEIFEKLWKKFFQTVAIKERKNLRCQMNFMPKKYWKYMLEMDGNNE